jgi:hypothetical protein
MTVTAAVAVACQRAPQGQRSDHAQHAAPAQSYAADAAAATDAAAAEALDAGVADAGSPTSACNEQVAQAFLVDAHFNGRSLATAEQVHEWKAAVARSIRYRTEQYGYFTGFGSSDWNSKSLRSQIRLTRFFGLAVRLHEKIIPALRCVEQALREECTEYPYQPHALSGVRTKNTYFDGDASNHVYGIAIDIDPIENPCCNCVEPWSLNPRCRGKKTDFERMAMPACWIPVFERFGFYWLGHDQLKDTMHFEFLGDADKIAREPG